MCQPVLSASLGWDHFTPTPRSFCRRGATHFQNRPLSLLLMWPPPALPVWRALLGKKKIPFLAFLSRVWSESAF